MYIDKIKIVNFKSFEGEFELKLNRDLNIIVGDNEAGKSTILEAINLVLCYWTTNFKLSFGQLFLNYLRLWSVSLSFLFCLSRMFFFLLLFLFTDQIFVSWRQAAFILVVTNGRVCSYLTIHGDRLHLSWLLPWID